MEWERREEEGGFNEINFQQSVHTDETGRWRHAATSERRQQSRFKVWRAGKDSFRHPRPALIREWNAPLGASDPRDAV